LFPYSENPLVSIVSVVSRKMAMAINHCLCGELLPGLESRNVRNQKGFVAFAPYGDDNKDDRDERRNRRY
jgi:hypothetical protein